jgi:predicted O-methyltransferase YrrM
MFRNIPKEIQDRMEYLAEIDARDRKDGTARLKRLRQIPPDTGKFIAILLASSPAGNAVEVGTSAGYSTMWLSLACRESRRKILTFELLEEKVRLARETFEKAKIKDVVELFEVDARKNLEKVDKISFCFLDAEKEIYQDIYDIVVPKMVRGGILVADNVISHGEELRPFVEKALGDKRVDAVVVPIGKGELVCRVL